MFLVWYKAEFGGEAPVHDIWGMWSTHLLPLLQGLLQSKVVVSIKVSAKDQMEVSNSHSYLIVILDAI